MKPGSAVYILILLLIGLFAACGGEAGLNPGQSQRTFDVDPQFREFYESMGGAEIVGPAISPLFSEENLDFQYLVSSLLVFDASKVDKQLFYLAALGREMNITWYTDGVGDLGIFQEFTTAYERLGGAATCGKAISGPHYNPQKHRYEQFLESVGFFRLETEPPGTVHLLAYGAWKCGSACKFQLSPETAVALPTRIDERLLGAVKSLGSDFTGFPLTDSYTNPDGSVEQVFENVVLYIPQNQAEHVYLASMSERLGIVADLLTIPSIVEGATFIPTNEEKGYQVPNGFLEYINRKGGLQTTGLPIGELMDLGDGVRRQCFTSLCLEMDEKVSDPLKIRPYPLGYTYAQMNFHTRPSQMEIESAGELNQVNPTSTEQIAETQQIQEISLQVREVYPWISPDQRQEISVTAFENGTPMSQAQLSLVLHLPEGSQKVYQMPPTNESGETSIILDPVNAASGTIIQYQICTSLETGDTYCVRDEFLVWIAP